MTKTLLLVLSGLLFCACGDDDTPADAGPALPDGFVPLDVSDAGPVEDTGPVDTDAGPVEDTGPVDTDAGPVEDAGPSDSGMADAGPMTTDAGPLCLLNSECPDDNLCSEIEEGTDNSFCIPGERGTTPYGDACMTSEQCVSGACLEGFCTMACDAVDACPSDNLPRCQPALGLCVPAA